MNKDNYPYIVLNYMDEETMYQNAVGDYLGNGTTGQRSTAMMSVNIYAKDAQGLNANQIAGGIALQLSQDIRENWKSLSSGTVRYIRKSPTRNLTSVMQSQGILDISRLQFDLILAYNLTW